jgi:hypothetical protein
MLERSALWSAIGWMRTGETDETRRLREWLDGVDSGWAGEDGSIIYKLYEKTPTADRDELDKVLLEAERSDDSTGRAKAAVLLHARLRDGQRSTGVLPDAEDTRLAGPAGDTVADRYWDGTAWRPATDGERKWMPGTGWVNQVRHSDAEDLGAVSGWESYRGWWRRHDTVSGTWLFATSNLRTATWVSQEDMVKQARSTADTYVDAVALATESDDQWRPYARWWRRYDDTTKTYRFALSNRRDADWVDMATMVAAESRPAQQQKVTENPTETPTAPGPLAAEQRVADDLVAQLRRIDGIGELSADELLTIIDEEFAS